MTGIFGVSSRILSLRILSTAKSPSVTGDLSGFIVIFSPCALKSLDTFPARKKVSISPSVIFFSSKLFNLYFF